VAELVGKAIEMTGPAVVFARRQYMLTNPAPTGAAILPLAVPSRPVLLPTGYQMTKRDLENRARRLSSLLDGLNAELVRLAMEKARMLADEACSYRNAVEQMTVAARSGLGALQAAISRLRREEERARGGDPWDVRR